MILPLELEMKTPPLSLNILPQALPGNKAVKCLHIDIDCLSIKQPAF